MTSSLRSLSSRFVAREACVFATLVATLTAACAGPPADEPEPLEGPALVAGTSLERHGLLVVPTGGGAVEFRSIDDPSVVRWTGRETLPPVSEAHTLGSTVVLRTAEGTSLYSTSPETLTPLPAVPEHARWIGSGAGGAFVASGWAMTITPDGVTEVRAESEILWAAPAGGGRVVALVEGAAGPQLVVWESGDSTPAATRDVATRGPVALAGWGQTVVGPSEDGGLTIWSIPELEPSRVVELDEAPVVLASSPSQHRLFVASGVRPKLVTIDRYDWRSISTIGTDAPLQALRSSPAGDRVIGFDGAKVWSVRAGEDRKQALPGTWRSDLPLALPNGAVLAVTAQGLRFVRGTEETSDIVEGPLDAWWLPFRWGPRPPVTAVTVDPEETIEDTLPPPSQGRAIGLLTMGRVAARTVAAPPPRVDGGTPERRPADVPGASGAPPASTALPGGFYAVATSSRELTSLGQLRRSLEGSGYSTHVLRRLDEANDTWYRLLVGPYESRPAAEAVARELRRERGIDAWIHEIVSDQPSEPGA